jgi:hypothetical protein
MEPCAQGEATAFAGTGPIDLQGAVEVPDQAAKRTDAQQGVENEHDCRSGPTADLGPRPGTAVSLEVKPVPSVDLMCGSSHYTQLPGRGGKTSRPRFSTRGS